MRNALVIVGTLLALSRVAPLSRGRRGLFEKRVRPILVEHCFSCHSASAPKLKASLRLDSRSGMLAGGDSGAAVIPGKPEETPARPRDSIRRCRTANAAERETAGRCDCGFEGMDQVGGFVAH